MTDNEIIRVLECCTTNGVSCKDCPAFVKVDRSNCKKYFRGALDLINRQKAEIERLKKGWKADVILTANIKSEAIKEFAEFLHEELRIYGIKEKFNKSVFLNVVDKAKKELVGEDG